MKKIDPKDLMAVERAVAALFGIAISFIALGFIIEKFELFIHLLASQGLKDIVGVSVVEHKGLYKWIGVVVVLAGALLAVYSYFYFKRWVTLLQNGEVETDKRFFLVIALFIVTISLILALSMLM